MVEPPNKVLDWQNERAKKGLPNREDRPLQSDGGDGTSGGMDGRLTALEKAVERIEKKLDRLDTISTDVAEVKGQMKGMPTAIQFGELKGRVDSLPTMAKISTLVGLVVVVCGAVAKWPEVLAFLRSFSTPA